MDRFVCNVDMYPFDLLRYLMSVRLFHLSETNLLGYYKVAISIASAKTARDVLFFFFF